MIMTRDQYEDALDAAFTHPLQHLPFDRATLANRGVGVGPSDGSGNGSGRGRGPRPLRPLKRTRTPPRTPKSPCLPLPLPLSISSPPRPPTPPPPLSLSLASQTESEPDEPVAPVPSPRSPFLPMAGGGPQVCRHCGLAYPNPEIDAYTPHELEQLDFLHAMGNWAWDDKCAKKLDRLRAPFERLHRQRPVFAEAIGAAARAGMNDYASRLVAGMDAQQCRINENLNSLKLHIMCNLHGHDGARAAEAWDQWMHSRTPWAPSTLRDMNAGSRGDPAALALELFRDVLRDLGEEEVTAVR